MPEAGAAHVHLPTIECDALRKAQEVRLTLVTLQRAWRIDVEVVLGQVAATQSLGIGAAVRR